MTGRGNQGQTVVVEQFGQDSERSEQSSLVQRARVDIKQFQKEMERQTDQMSPVMPMGGRRLWKSKKLTAALSGRLSGQICRVRRNRLLKGHLCGSVG